MNGPDSTLVSQLHSKIENKIQINYKNKDIVHTYININDIFIKKFYLQNEPISFDYESMIMLSLQIIDVYFIIRNSIWTSIMGK